MPVSAGSAVSNCANASRPPADAPIPTTESGALPFSRVCALCPLFRPFERTAFGRRAFFAIHTSGAAIIRRSKRHYRFFLPPRVCAGWLIQKTANSGEAFCGRCVILVFDEGFLVFLFRAQPIALG